MTSFAKVIALDGPSGSGKSSVAREVAKRLSMVYIDTGAMYRALGWYIDSLHIPFVEGPLLTQALSGAHLIYAKDPKVLISINGVDLTQTIREHRVSDLASRISKIPQVRNYLLDFQRNLGQETTSIMEGRDIGTVIFPSAFCKIFMTASEETRAQRRKLELLQKGEDLSLDVILKDIRERDVRDSQRETAPLQKADDAVLLDTSLLTFEEVVAKVITLAKERASFSKISL